MHIQIINALNWFSSSMKALNNKMVSSRFKRLEKKRINLLISKNKNMKKYFEEKIIKREEKFFRPIRPDVRFYLKTPNFCMSSLYKYKEMSSLYKYKEMSS